MSRLDNPDVLRRIASRRPVAADERCDLCGEQVADRHSHVVDIRTRSLMCTCRACHVLFTHDDVQLKYRSVPRRFLAFPDADISLGQWQGLAIPVDIAFLFYDSSLSRVVSLSPGQDGATESELPRDAWEDLVAANRGLETVRDDVEAVLLHKQGGGVSCFLVPVDFCYELTDHLRQLWRGPDGGDEARLRLEQFFCDVIARARVTDARRCVAAGSDTGMAAARDRVRLRR